MSDTIDTEIGEAEKPDIEPTAQAVQSVEGPKKRGRKPLPRDANGNIIRDGSAPATATVRHAKPQSPAITNEESGRAIQGAFMLASVGLGPHWRLFPQEQKDMGDCFGPLFRKYPDKIGDVLGMLMIAPTVVGVMMPRIMINKMRFDGDIEKGNERAALLNIVSYMEAEKHLNIEQQVKEANDFLRAKVAGAQQAAVAQHEKENS